MDGYSQINIQQIDLKVGSALTPRSGLLPVGLLRLFPELYPEHTKRDLGTDVIHNKHRHTGTEPELYLTDVGTRIAQFLVEDSRKTGISHFDRQRRFTKKSQPFTGIQPYIRPMEEGADQQVAVQAYIFQRQVYIVDVYAHIVQIHLSTFVAHLYADGDVIADKITPKRIDLNRMARAVEIFQEQQQAALLTIEIKIRKSYPEQHLSFGGKTVIGNPPVKTPDGRSSDQRIFFKLKTRHLDRIGLNKYLFQPLLGRDRQKRHPRQNEQNPYMFSVYCQSDHVLNIKCETQSNGKDVDFKIRPARRSFAYLYLIGNLVYF